MLTEHVTGNNGVLIYYGSRSTQPSRVRAFIDLAIERLGDSTEYVLCEAELISAEANGRKAL